MEEMCVARSEPSCCWDSWL